MAEVAEHAGVNWRTAYRVVADIEAAGIEVMPYGGGRRKIRRSSFRGLIGLSRQMDLYDRRVGARLCAKCGDLVSEADRQRRKAPKNKCGACGRLGHNRRSHIGESRP
jgi:hypothetical protein